jgi:hypothetical protein
MMLPAWAAFSGCFVLAALSYRLVELPIRRAAAKWRATTRGRSDRPADATRPVSADDRGVINAAVVEHVGNPIVASTIVRRDVDPA